MEHNQCFHPERWQEVRDALKRIEEKLDKLDDGHNDLHKRVFIGNGQPAMLTTLREHDQTLKALVWTTATLVSAMIVAGVGLTIRAVFVSLARWPT